MRSEHEAITEAFRQACAEADIKQETLAELAGVHQTTVSKWLVGKTLPPVYVLAIVDRLCDRRLGYVLRLAGLVEDDLDVRDRIATDPNLDAEKRQQLLGVYDIFRRDSAAEAGEAEDVPLSAAAERERILAGHALRDARPKRRNDTAAETPAADEAS